MAKESSITRIVISEEMRHAVSTLSNREARDMVDCIVEVIRDTLAQGEMVKISGFGKFYTRDKAERRGRDPQTGQAIMISARRVVSFKPADGFRHALNQDLS
jgi:integration host factor subunit alpha